MAKGQLLLEAGIHAQLYGEPGHTQGEQGKHRQHQAAPTEQPVLQAWQHATPPFVGLIYNRSIHSVPHIECETDKPT